MSNFDIKGTLIEVASVVQPITTIVGAANFVYQLLDGPRRREADLAEIRNKVDDEVNLKMKEVDLKIDLAIEKKFNQIERAMDLKIRKETAEQLEAILNLMSKKDKVS